MPNRFAEQRTSDDDLAEAVTHFLKQEHIPGTYRLTAKSQSGIVTLRGRVNSFYHRQLCIHAGGRVAGVRRIVDEIEVAIPEKKRDLTLATV
jgi:osmotically-inducible protein OsmY